MTAASTSATEWLMDPALKTVSARGFALVFALHAAREPQGIMELSRRLRTEAATVSRTARVLEEAGLLDCRPHLSDGRRIDVRLTTKARGLIAALAASA